MTWLAPHFHKARSASAWSWLRRDRFFVKTPGWLKRLYPSCTWEMPRDGKKLYLTFDDGPHPEVTPFLLDQLRQYGAKATFFCIGNNVHKYPAIYERILEEGHAVGNHTLRHVNGWKVPDNAYIVDTELAGTVIQSRLFRPPYGRIRRSQIRALTGAGRSYQIIMWSILAGDWIAERSPEECYGKVRRKLQGGDIIVFHDSDKARINVEYAIPRLLQSCTAEGYEFCPLPMSS